MKSFEEMTEQEREEEDKKEHCHDCACAEGELHNYFFGNGDCCDMERCPLCKGQMLSCGCDKSKITQEMREPFFEYTFNCKRCGSGAFCMLMLSNEDWEKLIGISYKQEDILCIECMKFIAEKRGMELKGRRC